MKFEIKLVILYLCLFISQHFRTAALFKTVNLTKILNSIEIYWQLHPWGGGLNAHHTVMLLIGIQYASSLSNTMCLPANGATEDPLSCPIELEVENRIRIEPPCK